MKGLYAENYKTLLKEIKIKLKYMIKIAVLPKKIDRVKVISNQNSSIFFFRNGKTDLQIHMKLKMGLIHS